MNNNSLLVFSCPCCCKGEVSFSVLSMKEPLVCDYCSSEYVFELSLQEAIHQFVGLCSSIHQASSVLGDAAVTVSTRESSVDVPFRLLFSRFPVVLRLMVNGKKIVIRFLFDALKEEVLHKESALLLG